MKKPVLPLTIFYDGSCIVCSTEIEHYCKKDRYGRLVKVDISASDFDPVQYGKSLQDFMSQLHVMDGEGTFVMGVEAFPVIWQVLPGGLYRFLTFLLKIPGLHYLSKIAYRIFAKNRQYLPRRKKECESDRCNFGHFK